MTLLHPSAPENPVPHHPWIARPAPDVGAAEGERRSVDELADSLCAGAANLTAYEYRWLRDLAEFDERQGWLQWEQVSCAAWLSWQVGLDARSAREKVRVARALAEMPLVAAAMERGQLCYSKVRAITRVATPATEEALVELALESTTAQLERVVAGTRRAVAVANDDAARRWAGRRLDHRVDADGMVVVSMRLTPDDAAAFLSAVANFTASTASGEAAEPLAARRADAAVAMALAASVSDSTLAPPSLVTVHVECGTSAVAGLAAACAEATRALDEVAGVAATAAGERADDRADDSAAGAVADGSAGAASVGATGSTTRSAVGAAIDPSAVHVNRTASPAVACSVGASAVMGEVPIGLAAAARHCCDAHVEVATHHADGSVTVSARSGVVRGRLRRAVLARDRHCQFPGCTRSAGVEVHHLVHRAHGGGNHLDNLTVLCRFHHHRLHDGGWSATRSAGGLVFTAPDGRTIAEPRHACGSPLPVGQLRRTAGDGRSRWQGDPLHLADALGFLASAAAVAERRARQRGRDAGSIERRLGMPGAA